MPHLPLIMLDENTLAHPSTLSLGFVPPGYSWVAERTNYWPSDCLQAELVPSWPTRQNSPAFLAWLPFLAYLNLSVIQLSNGQGSMEFVAYRVALCDWSCIADSCKRSNFQVAVLMTTQKLLNHLFELTPSWTFELDFLPRPNKSSSNLDMHATVIGDSWFGSDLRSGFQRWPG